MEIEISEFMYDQTVQLQEYLITTITQGHNPYMQMMFESRRKNLYNSAVPKNLLPDWLADIHSLSSFYQWIKEKGNGDQRKAFVCDSFKPALKYLQSKPSVIGGHDRPYSRKHSRHNELVAEGRNHSKPSPNYT